MADILLACGASAALHKGCDLASRLSQAGHRVRALLTPRAAGLISPQLFEALTEQPAFCDEFAASRHSAMDHIALAHWAQLLLVAPATADLLARLALGLGDDLACSVALAIPRSVPRIICPAMNPTMLAAPTTARHLKTLAGDGWRIVESDAGRTACGEKGKGRFKEPQAIVDIVQEIFPR